LEKSRAGNGSLWCCSLLLAGCASGTPTPEVPTFQGLETEHWLVQESAPIGRDDVLPAFEASAHEYGCATEHIGASSSLNIYGEMRSYYGVSAACEEGTIALITLVGGSIKIGCAKPTTRAACDQLLRNIAAAR